MPVSTAVQNDVFYGVVELRKSDIERFVLNH